LSRPRKPNQKAVIERAKARWQVVREGNVEGRLRLPESGSKAAATIAVYGGRARFKDIRSADVQSAECDAETCQVKVKVVLDHKLMPDSRSMSSRVGARKPVSIGTSGGVENQAALQNFHRGPVGRTNVWTRSDL